MSSQLQVSGEAKIRDIQGPVVANSGVITALDGAASQYVRGDGTLADFPTSSGGGSSVSYYLNSSVSQGTIGGVAYRQLGKTPIIGAGTDITISANGYVASYLTDANDPALLEVPAGNFNCEFYFSVNSNAHNPFIYAEVYKYDGTTFSLIGTSVGVPEYLSNGTTLSPYYFAIPVSQTVLTITDRIAIRIYVNVDGRVVTLHTENGHLCQVVTTFSKGLTSLNNLTRQVQFLGTGTSGTDFGIVSSVATHTFNLPVASAANTGKLSSTDWSTFNGKVPYTGANANVDLGNFNFDANEISGGAIIAKLNGPASSPFVLKTGSSGYTIGDDAISLVSSPTTANTLILASNIGVVTKTAQIGLGSLSATRTFTLPDISGTLALLEGSQTFTGGKTFSGAATFTSAFGTGLLNGFNLSNGNSPSVYTNTSVSVYADTGNPNLVVANHPTYQSKLQFQDVATLTSNYTYTFPAASGTIALTSNLSAYVPYTGATGNVNLGTNSIILGSIQSQSGILFNQLGGVIPSAGFTSISGHPNGLIIRIVPTKVIQLEFPADNFIYTYPSATGTLALTSDLGAYVTLATAQVITGSKIFGSSVSIITGSQASLSVLSSTGNSALILGYVNNVLKGTIDISATEFKLISAIDNILKFQSSTNFRASLIFSNSADYSYTYQNASGTIALLSGTQTFTGATTFSSSITVSGISVGTSGNGSNIKLGDTNFGAITTGSNNIAIGSSALSSITTSNANIGIGNSALASVVDGAFNIALGFGVGASITSGSNNTLFGYGAGQSITTGNYNTILGAYAGTAGMSSNIVLADGQGNIRYQWNGTNNVFGNPISGTSATFSGALKVSISSSGATPSAAADDFIIESSGTSGMSILSGNTSFGTLYFGRASDAVAGRIEYNHSTNNMSLFTNGASQLSIASTGAATFSSSVGIGAANSIGILDAYTTTKTGVRSWTNIAGTTNNFLLQNSANYNYGIVGVVSASGTATGDVYGLGYTASAGTSMTPVINWTSGGNVGIGTPSPSAPLQINKDGASEYSALRFSNANSSANFFVGVGGSSVSNTSLRNNAYVLNAAATDLILGTSDTERMRITSGGVVAINNQVANTAYALGIKITGTTIRNGIDIVNDYEGASAAGDNFSCYNNVNGIVTMQVKGNGNLVNYNNSYGAISDAKLKENIVDATSKLDDILKLKVRNFNFINTEHKQIGFIAQELEEVFPSLIEEAKNPNTNESFKTIKTSVLVPILVKAIQELNERIKQLENK